MSPELNYLIKNNDNIQLLNLQKENIFSIGIILI